MDKTWDEKIVNLAIVSKICLKHPCEEYSTMSLSESERHLSNLPWVAKNWGLNRYQHLAVSFVNADGSNGSIVIELE